MRLSGFLAIVSLIAISVTSCGKSVNCENFTTGNSLFEDEISKVTDALFVFDVNPGFENCERVRDAYQDYIDALKEWEDCAVQNGQGLEFQEFIRDAEKGIEELECI